MGIKKTICKLFFAMLIVGLAFTILPIAKAQPLPRYWKDVIAFKVVDSNIHIPQNPILLIGSSSFTNWKTLAEDFAAYPMLNRAFGGAIYQDIIRYFYDIIIPYKPKQIIVYCGDNDLGFFNFLPEEILANCKTLLAMIRVHFPHIEVDFLSIKPSPLHRNKQNAVQKTNLLIGNFLKNQPHTQYIDIYTPMLDKNGDIKKDIFLPDSLHINKKGYDLWKKIILPYLKQ